MEKNRRPVFFKSKASLPFNDTKPADGADARGDAWQPGSSRSIWRKRMTAYALNGVHATHEVTNQVPPLEGYNAYLQDKVLRDALGREGGGWAADHVSELGSEVGSGRMQTLARLANRFIPELRTHDRFGNRIDFVEFHPAYHEIMKIAFGAGVHSFAWTAARPGGHVARAALSYLMNQGENGVCCPTGMAYSAIPVLRRVPGLEEWVSKLTSTEYDPDPVPIGRKAGATIGMTFTEKQGGSDLRANVTKARPIGAASPGSLYEIEGHKWFCSAPMSDGFIVLAYAQGGPTAFLVPRALPDGSRNRFLIQRLKDKCGNKSNASSEVEFSGTLGIALCEEGRGIRTAIEIAHLTRIDFAIGSTGLMRQALTQALHHTTHRRAFQRFLADLPAMRNTLADLAIEWEANTLMTMRLARCFDASPSEDREKLLERIGTPIAKYWVCKRAPAFVAEALECHGGNGFIEEHIMPRLYREAPLNGIWEGTGNLIALDVLRAMQREPGSTEAFLDEVRKGCGTDPRLDRFVDLLEDELADRADQETRCRRIVEMMALAFQASLLLRHAPAAVADAFCASRIEGAWRGAYGTLPSGCDFGAIIHRARIDTD
jgi:putative acyl-CoA dehydrogenase